MRRWAQLAVGVCCLGVVTTAYAHPLAPASLLLREEQDGRIEAVYRTAAASDARLDLVLPERCKVVREDATERDGRSVVRRGALTCGERGLQGAVFRIRGLSASGVNALVRIQHADGSSTQALLGGLRESFRVPSQPRSGQVFLEYLALGVEHLWTGLDHVLFLLTLLMAVRRRRRAIWALTAFTVGHSLTLCMAVLDVVRVPQGPVEVGIAASLVWMAASSALAQPARRSVAWVAVGFGLLHGLGFSGVLRDAGLAASDVPWSLFAFNLGIELGQVVLALLAWTLAALWLRFRHRSGELARLIVSYGAGGLAALWVLERSLSLIE